MTSSVKDINSQCSSCTPFLMLPDKLLIHADTPGYAMCTIADQLKTNSHIRAIALKLVHAYAQLHTAMASHDKVHGYDLQTHA